METECDAGKDAVNRGKPGELSDVSDSETVPSATAEATPQPLPPANTATGRTKTLQLIAEQLSAQGVPDFLADVKNAGGGGGERQGQALAAPRPLRTGCGQRVGVPETDGGADLGRGRRRRARAG